MLYAGDLNAIQALVAALADFTQSIQLSVLEVGDSSIQLSKLGAGLAGLSSSLTVTGILKGLSGLVAGTYTTTQMNALVSPPYGLVILNTTLNQYMWQSAPSGSPVWTAFTPTEATSQVGTLADMPAANAVSSGSTYFANDQIVDYVSDGSEWWRKGVPAGATVEWHSAVATPAGWVVYDGTALSGSTGIYAALYAALGNTLTKPDTRGRATYGVGTNTDINAVGENDGLAVSSRSPKHNHTFVNPSISEPSVDITDPGHGHTLQFYNQGDDGVNGYPSSQHTYANDYYRGPPIVANVTGITAALSGAPLATGGEVGPGGTRPTDSGGYIGAYKIAKL